MGVSRSASVVLAYLLQHSTPALSLKQAMTMVRARRGHVLPNRAFLKLLAEKEKENGFDTYDECFAELYPRG
jgi:protein-tyrosine phosphatase